MSERVVLDGLGNPIRPGNQYLISDDRSRGSSFVIWWCPESRGYTSSLDDAGIYSGEKAAEICREGGSLIGNLYEHPVAWPVHAVYAQAMRAVACGDLRELTRLACAERERDALRPA